MPATVGSAIAKICLSVSSRSLHSRSTSVSPPKGGAASSACRGEPHHPRSRAALALVKASAGVAPHVRAVRPRGGLFLALAGLLLVVPWQVLGEARERAWWQTYLFALGYSLLVIPSLLLAALDPLDRRKHFTLGYAVLCEPR